MYAVDSASSTSQSNAKSTLQALLKTREQNSTSTSPKYFSYPQDTQSSYLNQAPLPLYFENSGASEHSNVPSSPAFENLAENLDNTQDFNYSQKLFHIADGNLYSVFSPIQGRSYGMKPSFLRKQKYTVQECRSRSRKHLRKGLKFHNFLPSESVTSEKDHLYLKKWKVHSECRLREEHGTKQITISNWSQSVQNNSKEQSSASTGLNDDSYLSGYSVPAKRLELDSASTSSEVKSNKPKSAASSNMNRHTFLVPNHKLSPSFNESHVLKAPSECSISRKDVLDDVLNSPINSLAEPKKLECDVAQVDSNDKYQNQRHRRKPVQTRRIVPYTKYLTLIKETESSPLDLSSKNAEDDLVPVANPNLNLFDMSSQTYSNNEKRVNKNNFTYAVKRNEINHSSQNPNITLRKVKTSNKTVNNHQKPENIPSTFLCPINPAMANFHKMLPLPDSKYLNLLNGPKNYGPPLENPSSLLAKMQPANSNPYMMPQKAVGKESNTRTRRRSHRSVIKQKLEDTFKQNGFLVKTKQVSDGEATFCKFRQLRKYTRYYLKSWQQHLPDEVHKMWKGFLPPKTVISPTMNQTENHTSQSQE